MSKPIEHSRRRRDRVARPTTFALTLVATLAVTAYGQTVLTVTRTAASTVTANTLVEESGTTGNIVTATDGGCTGVALNTGTAVQVVEYGTAAVLLGTTSAIVGDLVTCPSSGTTGYGVDSGVTSVAGVDLGVQIIGRIISAAAPGASTTLATVQLFGPGVAGTGWVPLVNGFYQFPFSNFPGSPYTDSYNYKMCAPVQAGSAPSACTPAFVPNTSTTSSYAGWWIDRGAFGNIYGTTAVAPGDYELLRLSAVTQSATRENTLEVFDATTTGLGSVPITAFNEAYMSSPSVIMYGANLHVSGCEGIKCVSQPNHDIGKIGLEVDIEDRSPNGRTSPDDVGLYLALLNSLFSQNYAIVIGSNTAGGGTSVPWGTGLYISGAVGSTASQGTKTGIEIGPGGAATAIKIDPLATTGASNSQPLSQCAFSSGTTQVCTNLTTTSASHFVVGAPGLTALSSPVGLQADHYAGFATAPGIAGGAAIGSGTATVQGNDFSGTVSVTVTTISIGTIATLTFANAYTNSVTCLVAQNGGGSGAQVGVAHSQTLTTLTISATVAGGSSAYKFDFFCSGY